MTAGDNYLAQKVKYVNFIMLGSLFLSNSLYSYLANVCSLIFSECYSEISWGKGRCTSVTALRTHGRTPATPWSTRDHQIPAGRWRWCWDIIAFFAPFPALQHDFSDFAVPSIFDVPDKNTYQDLNCHHFAHSLLCHQQLQFSSHNMLDMHWEIMYCGLCYK